MVRRQCIEFDACFPICFVYFVDYSTVSYIVIAGDHGLVLCSAIFCPQRTEFALRYPCSNM